MPIMLISFNLSYAGQDVQFTDVPFDVLEEDLAAEREIDGDLDVLATEMLVDDFASNWHVELTNVSVQDS